MPPNSLSGMIRTHCRHRAVVFIICFLATSYSISFADDVKLNTPSPDTQKLEQNVTATAHDLQEFKTRVTAILDKLVSRFGELSAQSQLAFDQLASAQRRIESLEKQVHQPADDDAHDWTGRYPLLGFIETEKVETVMTTATRVHHEPIVYVMVGEPTQIVFPAEIDGGFKRKDESVVIERKQNFLMIVASDQLLPTGEALLVVLKNGQSFPLRIKLADAQNPRDAIYQIHGSDKNPGTEAAQTPSAK